MYYLTETDPRGAMGLGGKDETASAAIGSYLTAIDYKTGKIVWRHKFRTATGDRRGGAGPADDGRRLLFGGDVSGNFVAYDPANGKPLWHARIGRCRTRRRPTWWTASSTCSSRPATRLYRVHACI